MQFSPCVYLQGAVQVGISTGSGAGTKVHPTAPARSRTARSTGAAPALSIAYFLGNQAGPRLAQDVGPWVGLAQHSPCLGRAGLGRTRDCPCCVLVGAGDDGPGADMGSWAMWEAPERLSRDSQGWWWPEGPDTYISLLLHIQLVNLLH